MLSGVGLFANVSRRLLFEYLKKFPSRARHL